MIELAGVLKRYDGNGGVGPLDLTLPAGRTTALLGPSGCGKSTLLRLIVGLVAPDAGQVRVNGEPVTASSAPGLRRRLGYVIQEGGLFPHLTAADNAALMARYLGWDERRVAARLAALVTLLRLDPELLARFPVELSGGQRQRVALLRALMLDPEVLLLDEPLGALDPMIRAGLQDELGELFRELGKTVVLVTHDVAEAGFLAHGVVLLRDGHALQTGTLAELVARPADPFVERFLGAQRGWSA